VSTQLTTPTIDSASNGAGSPNGASPGGSQPNDAPVQRKCAKCGAAMQPLQDWCLQCGAGAPNSLARPSRTAAMVALAVVVVLVAGASAAAYAALSKKGTSKPVIAAAKAPLTTATSPTATPATPAAPGATTTPGAAATGPGTPTTIKGTPPKIPLQTPTPNPSSTEEAGAGGGPNEEANNALFGGASGKATKPSAPAPSKPSGGSSKASNEEASAPEGGEGGGEAKSNSAPEPPSPILLDTNAASTYNPYSYPATRFGDPSLAIDGEAKTAWTAQVDPASAPKMAEGLVLDMRTAQSVGSAIVKTTTTGVTVAMYGANGHNLPASITDHAWKRLSGSKVLKKKSTKLTLKTKGAGYRFILLWVAKAPAGSTPSKPGSVSIDELELFP